MVDLHYVCTMLIIIARMCVADLDHVMIPYVDISCDEMKRNSHVFNTHYNNVGCNTSVAHIWHFSCSTTLFSLSAITTW